MPSVERFKLFFDLAPFLLPYIIFMICMFSLLIVRSYFARSKIFDFLIVISIVLFGGLKEPFTWDLGNYRYMFENPQSLSITWITPMFIIFVKIVHVFTNNYLIFFLFYELMTILFIYLSIEKFLKGENQQYILAWLTFLSFPFLFLNSFGVEIREVFAYSVFLYASICWILGEKKKAYVFFVISALSHYSAIFAIVIWIISNILFDAVFSKMRNAGVVMILIMVIALLSAHYIGHISEFLIHFTPLSPSIKKKYISYFFAPEVTPVGKLLMMNFFGIISAVLIDKLKANKTNLNMIKVCYFFIIGIILLNSTFLYGPVSRVAYYFLSLVIFLIPEISKTFKPHILSNLTLYILLMCIFLYGLFYITPFGDYAFLPCRSLICEVFRNAF